MSAPIDSNTIGEDALFKTLVEFLQFSYQYQVEQQSIAPAGTTAPFTNILLMNMRQCVKSVLIVQMEKSQLRQILLQNRSLAEIMHLIVTIGDKIYAIADVKLSMEWQQTRDAFMSMLES